MPSFRHCTRGAAGAGLAVLLLLGSVVVGCSSYGHSGLPVAQASCVLLPDDILRYQEWSLKWPDLEGPLSAGLKVRAEADTWDELVAKVKPTLTWGRFQGKPMPDCGFPDMMWVEVGPDGKPVFRLEQALTWKPAGQKARWVLLESADIQMSWNGKEGAAVRPEKVAVVNKRPLGYHPVSYAIVKGRQPRNGVVYEVGWAMGMCPGNGLWESLHLL